MKLSLSRDPLMSCIYHNIQYIFFLYFFFVVFVKCGSYRRVIRYKFWLLHPVAFVHLSNFIDAKNLQKHKIINNVSTPIVKYVLLFQSCEWEIFFFFLFKLMLSLIFIMHGIGLIKQYRSLCKTPFHNLRILRMTMTVFIFNKLIRVHGIQLNFLFFLFNV